MIINLTQHVSTPEQKMAGVVDLDGSALEELHRLLTFNSIPAQTEIWGRAHKIAALAAAALSGSIGKSFAMVGGAPFLMSALEQELSIIRIEPLYAFSRRESEETLAADGSVKKTAVFRHVGFVAVI